MTTHPWSTNVIGGVGVPRVILCSGYNLILNNSFEDNLNGWVANDCNIFREAETTTPQGNYCLKVSDTNALIYGSANCLISSINNPLISGICSGKKFILTFYAKEGDPDIQAHNVTCVLRDSSHLNFVTKTFAVTKLGWVKISIILECDYGNPATGIVVELGAVENLFETGSVRYDFIELYEIDNDYYLEIPQQFHQNYNKVMNYEVETWDGEIRDSIKGYRYNAELAYEFVTAGQLQTFIEISEATFCLFLPHSDSSFSARVSWDGDFDYKYFKNKYLGHEMNMKLKGREIMTNKPKTIGSELLQLRASITTYLFV